MSIHHLSPLLASSIIGHGGQRPADDAAGSLLSRFALKLPHTGGPQIYRIDASGSGTPERITFEGSYNARPRLSPDGSKLATVHLDRGAYRIAVMTLEDRQMLVLSTGQQDESPSFAPNSDTLIYATREAGTGVLETVTADGLVRQRLASGEGDVREPVWSPYPRN